jgi:hypothetical protein
VQCVWAEAGKHDKTIDLERSVPVD